MNMNRSWLRRGAIAACFALLGLGVTQDLLSQPAASISRFRAACMRLGERHATPPDPAAVDAACRCANTAMNQAALPGDAIPPDLYKPSPKGELLFVGAFTDRAEMPPYVYHNATYARLISAIRTCLRPLNMPLNALSVSPLEPTAAERAEQKAKRDAARKAAADRLASQGYGPPVRPVDRTGYARGAVRFFPVRAQEREVSGSATLALEMDAEGRVSSATVVEETPEGWGFGDAAIQAVTGHVFVRTDTDAPAPRGTFKVAFRTG